jgi:hypothetical protein
MHLLKKSVTDAVVILRECDLSDSQASIRTKRFCMVAFLLHQIMLCVRECVSDSHRTQTYNLVSRASKCNTRPKLPPQRTPSLFQYFAHRTLGCHESLQVDVFLAFVPQAITHDYNTLRNAAATLVPYFTKYHTIYSRAKMILVYCLDKVFVHLVENHISEFGYLLGAMATGY